MSINNKGALTVDGILGLAIASTVAISTAFYAGHIGRAERANEQLHQFDMVVGILTQALQDEKHCGPSLKPLNGLPAQRIQPGPLTIYRQPDGNAAPPPPLLATGMAFDDLVITNLAILRLTSLGNAMTHMLDVELRATNTTTGRAHLHTVSLFAESVSAFNRDVVTCYTRARTNIQQAPPDRLQACLDLGGTMMGASPGKCVLPTCEIMGARTEWNSVTNQPECNEDDLKMALLAPIGNCSTGQNRAFHGFSRRPNNTAIRAGCHQYVFRNGWGPALTPTRTCTPCMENMGWGGGNCGNTEYLHNLIYEGQRIGQVCVDQQYMNNIRSLSTARPDLAVFADGGHCGGGYRCGS